MDPISAIVLEAQPLGNQCYLFISHGNKIVAVPIDGSNAFSIHLAKHQESALMPFCHDLLCNALNNLHVKITEIQITKKEDDIYHTSILFSPLKTSEITPFYLKAKLSDAAALAVRVQLPLIFSHILWNDLPDSTDLYNKSLLYEY